MTDLIDREAFQARRRKSLGGSEWAMALGCSKWGDPLRLYMLKRGLVSIEETARMEMGQYMEGPLLDWYLNRSRQEDDATLVDSGRQLSARANPPFDFLTGTSDLIVTYDNGGADRTRIVDAKNAGFRAVLDWGEPGTDAIPMDALMQAHAYLYLWPAADQVDFVVLRGMKWPPAIYTVLRDEAHDSIVESALPVLRSLWFDHIQAGIPPEPDFASPFALDSVKALFPARSMQRPDPVTLAPTVRVGAQEVATAELLEAHALLKKIESEAASRAKRVEAAIRGALGENLAGEAAGIIASRIYNKGGHRPAHDVAPYDYLKLKFPKDYERKITQARIAAFLPEVTSKEASENE